MASDTTDIEKMHVSIDSFVSLRRETDNNDKTDRANFYMRKVRKVRKSRALVAKNSQNSQNSYLINENDYCSEQIFRKKLNKGDNEDLSRKRIDSRC